MKPLSPGDILRAKKRAIGGKRPRCTKGISCSAACINMDKSCLVALPSPVSKSLSKVSTVRAKIQSKLAARQRKIKIQNAVEVIKKEMYKAIENNDRAKYDKLEAKLFKIRSKIGKSVIRDTELRSASAGEMWNRVKDKSYLSNLKSSINEGKREGVSNIKVTGKADNFMVFSKVLGNDLTITVIPNDTTIFEVNGSLKASDNLPKRDTIAIIREANRQYNEIFKGMRDGVVLEVSADGGDGREGTREKGYLGRGFSKPDRFGSMYGMVKDGGIVPISKEIYEDRKGDLL